MTSTRNVARSEGDSAESPDDTLTDRVKVDDVNPSETSTVQRPARRGRALVLALIAVVVAAALVVGGFLFFHKSNSGTDSKTAARNAATALTAGLAAQTKGDLAGATGQFNKVLKYDKNNKYAIYDLAIIDSAQSNYGLAQSKYRTVLGIDPAYEPALFNLAILVQASDKAGAIALYQRAVKAAPKDASAHLNLGLLLRSSGQKAAGNAQVKMATTLNPKLVDPARQSASPAPATK